MGTTANSTAPFNIVAYESNIQVADAIVNLGFIVRVSDAVLALTINGTQNAAPDAQLIQQTGILIRTSGSRRRFGIVARHIVIGRRVGTSPLQFVIRRTVPIIVNGCWNAIQEAYPPVISYQSQTDWKLISTRQETADIYDAPIPN